jgi:hypothetical protein
MGQNPSPPYPDGIRDEGFTAAPVFVVQRSVFIFQPGKTSVSQLRLAHQSPDDGVQAYGPYSVTNIDKYITK